MTISKHDEFSSLDDGTEYALDRFGHCKIIRKAPSKIKCKKNKRAAANSELFDFSDSDIDKPDSTLSASSLCKTGLNDDINRPVRKRLKLNSTLLDKPGVLACPGARNDGNDVGWNKAIRVENRKVDAITNLYKDEKGRVRFTDRDGRRCPVTSSSSRADERKYFNGDTAKASKEKTDTMNKENEGKFHGVWSLLQKMKAFDFPTTPHISEESLVIKKVNKKKRYINKAPVSVASTGDSYHNGTVKNQNTMVPIKVKENYKMKNDVTDRMSIKDIYLSKYAGRFTHKKIRKPLNETHSIEKVSQISKYTSNSRNKKKVFASERSERSFKQSKRSITNSTSHCTEFKTENFLQSTSDWSQTDADNKSIDFKNKLQGNESTGILNYSSYCSGSSKNMKGATQSSRGFIGSTCSPVCCFNESGRIIISYENQQKQTENKRKLRLNTTIPTADTFSRQKFTTAEIKKQLAKLKFPLVILGKNEVSSTIKIPAEDTSQFEGLEDHIWPFMANWTQKSQTNLPRSKDKKRFTYSTPISHRLKNSIINSASKTRMKGEKDWGIIYIGESNRQHQKNTIKQNQQKNEYCESSGDLKFAQSYFSDADTQTAMETSKSISIAPTSSRRKYLSRSVKKTLTNMSRITFDDTKHSITENNYLDYLQIVHPHRHNKTTPSNKNVVNNTRNTKDCFSSRRTVYTVGGRNEPSRGNGYLTTYTLYSRKDAPQLNREVCLTKQKSRSNSVRSRKHTISDSMFTVCQSLVSADSKKTLTSNYGKKMIENRTSGLNTMRNTKIAQGSLFETNENVTLIRDDKKSVKNSIFANKYGICAPSKKRIETKTTAKDSGNSLRNTLLATAEAPSWWLSHKSDRQHDTNQIKLSVIPSAIQVNAKLEPNKRANDIVQNAIKMLELGFFYNCVTNSEEKLKGNINKSNVNKSVETLVQKDVNSNSETENCVKCELVNSVAIPGFGYTNDLPFFEIKTMNENEVALKTCNEDVMIQFDVVEPESSELNTEKSLSFDEIPKFSASKTHISKVFKCKPSVFNSMLPAELCTLIPSIIRKLENNKDNQKALPSNNSFLSVTNPLASKLHQVPPKILPFIISPELIQYRQGSYTNVTNHRKTTEVAKIGNVTCCFYNNHNILVAQGILSQVKTLSRLSIWLMCLKSPMTSRLATTKQISFPTSESSLITREIPVAKLNVSAQYLINKMMGIINDFKVTFDFVYNYSNDSMSIDITCNKVPNTKSLIPYTKNMSESLKIVNVKINSIYDSVSGSKVKNLPDMTLHELKLIPTEREITAKNSHLSTMSCNGDIEAKSRIKVIEELETNNDPRKVHVNVALRNKYNLPKSNIDLHWSQVLKNLRIVANNKRSVGALYKCKSSSSLLYTPISKINKLDDFIHAMGAVGISAALDGNIGETLLSSIVLMREWISEITPRQALLVLLLANKKTTANLIRLRPLLLQAISVNRITTASELDTEIEVLERERLKLMQLQNEEVMYPATTDYQKDLYEELCWIAKTTASDYQKTFDESSEKLLKSLLEKRKKLNPSYLRVMARYVGLGLLKSPFKTNN